MTYDEALKTLEELEGRAVEVDTVLVNPAPGAVPGIHRGGGPGILRREEPWEVHEFWWTKPEAAYFDCIPCGGFVLWRQRFLDARWDGPVFELDEGAIRFRIVPLVRSDGWDPARACTANLRAAPARDTFQESAASRSAAGCLGSSADDPRT